MNTPVSGHHAPVLGGEEAEQQADTTRIKADATVQRAFDEETELQHTVGSARVLSKAVARVVVASGEKGTGL